MTPTLKQETMKHGDTITLEKIQTKIKFLEDSNIVMQTRNQNLITENKALASQWVLIREQWTTLIDILPACTWIHRSPDEKGDWETKSTIFCGLVITCVIHIDRLKIRIFLSFDKFSNNFQPILSVTTSQFSICSMCYLLSSKSFLSSFLSTFQREDLILFMFREVGRVQLRLLKQYYWTSLYRSRIKKKKPWW